LEAWPNSILIKCEQDAFYQHKIIKSFAFILSIYIQSSATACSFILQLCYVQNLNVNHLKGWLVPCPKQLGSSFQGQHELERSSKPRRYKMRLIFDCRHHIRLVG